MSWWSLLTPAVWIRSPELEATESSKTTAAAAAGTRECSSSSSNSPHLPEELILYILTFNGCTGLAKASRLNRRFRSILYSTPSIWRTAFENEYGPVSHRECQLLSSTEDWRTLSARRTRPRVHFRRGNAVVTRLRGHKGWVTSGVLSYSHVITASRDSTLKVWDAETGTHRADLEGHAALIRAVKANERIVISGSSDRTLMIWNLKSGASATLGTHDASVTCLDATLRLQEAMDGIAVSGAGDQMVRMWDIQTCQPLGTKSGSIGMVNCVRLLHSGSQLVASGGVDRILRIFDLREPDHAPPQLSLFGHTRKIFNLEPLAEDEYLLISESHSGREVFVWDLRHPEEPLHRIIRDSVITSFSLSDYASSQPGGIHTSTSVYQPQTNYLGPAQHPPQAHRNPNPRIREMEAGAIVFGGDEECKEDNSFQQKHHRQLLTLGLQDGTVEVWDPILGTQTHRSPLIGTRSPVTVTTLQSDGRLVAGHRDGRIAGWDIHTGANCWVYNQPQNSSGMPISLSMNDSKLVVGMRSSTGLLFDFNEGSSSLPPSGSTFAWWDRLRSPLGNRSSQEGHDRVILRSGQVSSV